MWSRFIVLSTVYFFAVLSEAAETAKSESKTSLTGVPRLMRQMGQVEVFFKDLPQSYFIDSGSAHNRNFELIQKAMKTGAAVSFSIRPQTRMIVDVSGPGMAAANATTAPPTGPSLPATDLPEYPP